MFQTQLPPAQDFPTQASIILELLKTGLSLGLLIVTWLLGQRIIAFWDIRKKQQEIDTAAAAQFQQLYGDLKEVARLWREVSKIQDHPFSTPPDIRWQLLVRATSAEGRFEAVVMKLATERLLEEKEIKSIGLFRQASQDLREAIREGRSLPAIRFGGGYTLFNNLAAEITCLLANNRSTKAPSREVAQQNLDAIAKIGSAVWRNEIGKSESRLPASNK
ncbi:MAG TPA: hypothetical protein VGD58_20865 [Herpetosiphonaceae bacterium]